MAQNGGGSRGGRGGRGRRGGGGGSNMPPPSSYQGYMGLPPDVVSRLPTSSRPLWFNPIMANAAFLQGPAAGVGYSNSQVTPKKEDANEGRKPGAAIPQYEPSPIVLLRRVSWDITQGMLEEFGKKFGPTVRVIMLRSKNHALIEFQSLESAQKMVEHFKQHSNSQADLNGHQVTVGYCKHQRWVAPEPSKTLLASLFDSQHHITECLVISPGLIYQLFSNFGSIEAIVVLEKKAAKNRVQALVQFVDCEHARRVKERMQGLPVWFGGRTQLALDLLYSKVDTISCRLFPGWTMVIPREVVEVHRRMVEKYGSLEVYYQDPRSLTEEQLLDFKEYVKLLKKHASEQRNFLKPRMEELKRTNGDVSAERIEEVLKNLHAPIVADWNKANGVTEEKQEKYMETMKALIRNGGMAATCRLLPTGDGGGDDDYDEIPTKGRQMLGEAFSMPNGGISYGGSVQDSYRGAATAPNFLTTEERDEEIDT